MKKKTFAEKLKNLTDIVDNTKANGDEYCHYRLSPEEMAKMREHFTDSDYFLDYDGSNLPSGEPLCVIAWGKKKKELEDLFKPRLEDPPLNTVLEKQLREVRQEKTLTEAKVRTLEQELEKMKDKLHEEKERLISLVDKKTSEHQSTLASLNMHHHAREASLERKVALVSVVSATLCLIAGLLVGRFYEEIARFLTALF